MTTWFSLEGLWTIFLVAVGLGMVIFVHELGHFLVAKACGVKCEKFYVGFDSPIRIGPWQLPRTFGKFQWGETEYGIGIIPLGGYVKMLGQDDNPANYQKEAERIQVKTETDGTETDSTQTDDSSASDEQPPAQLDPRSYPAKSVPKRMAIISAGVVMNIIFAVIFATIAYRIGVTYTPCELGGTVPGYPAWKADLRPGDRIIQIGREGQENQQLRFSRDLRGEVLLSGDDNEIDFLIQRGEEKIWATLTPTEALGADRNTAAIGVYPMHEPVVELWRDLRDPTDKKESDRLFQKEDRILEINGESIKDGIQLQVLLANTPDQELTVTVERKADNKSAANERQTVTVPTMPMRNTGLIMRIGPVTEIRNGSPAAQAGFKTGDVIKSFDGQPVGDPMTLAERTRRRAGEETQFEVQRGSETVPITVVPQRPRTYIHNASPGSPVPVESLGIVFAVSNIVDGVEAGSPAAEQGLQKGDQIVAVEIFATHDQRSIEEEKFGDLEKIDLGTDKQNWPYVFYATQRILNDTKLRLTYKRNGKKSDPVLIAPVESGEWYLPDRGIIFSAVSEPLKIQEWSHALSLGYRQTKEDVMMVARVLKKLTTGGLSPTHLGGPGTIVAAAGSEASEGIGRLLLFLTLLSANLAVINFLPIPVLDGGHMLFLAAEGIRGKPVNEKLQFQLTLLGLAFILTLMIFVIGLDVFRFSQWFF